MKKYDEVFKYSSLTSSDLKHIQDLLNHNPNLKILIDLANTKNLDNYIVQEIPDSVDIRIAGAYDEDFVKKFGSEYYDSVIYSKNELFHIINVIEKIEFVIADEWSDLEKMVYIYERLKSAIRYDPKFEQKTSKDLRSLKCLFSRQTVCAGFALVFKELLERQDIRCDFATGIVPGGNAHAWNIVQIDDKLYPIDLTWEASNFQRGNFQTINYFGQNNEHFRKKHVPFSSNAVVDYENTLSSFEPNLIKSIRRKHAGTKDYLVTTSIFSRKDKSRFLLTYIGQVTIDGKTVYSYVYADVINGKYENPTIYYSLSSLQKEIRSMHHGKPVLSNLKYAIANVLFSPENIQDSKSKNTDYLGSIFTDEKTKENVHTNASEILKDQKLCETLTSGSKVLSRSDGSKLILRKKSDKPKIVNGVKVYNYDCYEILIERNIPIVKFNTIWSEQDLTLDDRKEVADHFLSRKRLDDKALYFGGYLGSYENGMHVSNSKLTEFFDAKKAIDTRDAASALGFPTFDELQFLATNYKLVRFSDKIPVTVNSYKAVDIETNVVLPDPKLTPLVFFAKLWLKSAGIQIQANAFSDEAKMLYYWLISRVYDSIVQNGYIDSADIYNKAQNIEYSSAPGIIKNLFYSPASISFFDAFAKVRINIFSSEKSELFALKDYSEPTPSDYGARK